jgi:hypothetical protein
MAWRGWSGWVLPESIRSRLRVPRLAVEMLVALSLASLVWLYIRTRDHESLDHVPVQVQITLAPDCADQYDLEVDGSRHVMVSFVGPPSGIRELRGMLQRGEVRIQLPLTVPEDRRNESHYRDRVRIEASDVPVPAGVTAMVESGGNRIPVTLYRLVERPLSVHLNHASGERIRHIDIEPATVLVRGPEEILDRAQHILTQPYHLPPLSASSPPREETLSLQMPLAREMEGRPVYARPALVKVHLVLQPPPQVYELTSVPVKFLCPVGFPFRPEFTREAAAKVSLRVRAPAGPVPPTVTAFIDLTVGSFRPGLNVEPLRLQLPKECQLAQEQPEPLGFELVPTETASRWLGVVTEP